MLFKRKREKTDPSGISAVVRNETSQQCLDPEYLVGNLTLALSKKIKSTSGHVHIYFRGKVHHIIILWSNGKLRKIMAKSQNCKKGQCVKWDESQLADYKREDVLAQLYNEIEQIRIDMRSFDKTWPSWQAFVDWLIKKIN